MQETKQRRVAISCINVFAEVLHAPLCAASKQARGGHRVRMGRFDSSHTPTWLHVTGRLWVACEGAAIRTPPFPYADLRASARSWNWIEIRAFVWSVILPRIRLNSKV